MRNLKIDESLYNDIKSGMNIIPDEEYKQILLVISELAADMVKKTLGPYAHTTLLDDGTFTYATKDGYTTLKMLQFNDPIYNILFKLIREISFNIVSKVGDGTTTALVAANYFIKELASIMESKPIIKNARQKEILDALENVKDLIIEKLYSEKYLYTINRDGDYSDIRKLAYISSNGNDKLSDMLQDIYQKTNNGNIFVTFDGGNDITYEIEDGYRLDCKLLNHKAYINTDEGYCKKTNKTMVAVFDHNVTYSQHGEIITMLSKYANYYNSEVIILAPYYDDVITTVIGSTINSMLQKGQAPNILMIQVPLSMDIHREYLSDVVMLTNAQVFDYGTVRACNIIVSNDKHPDEKIEDTILNVDQYMGKTVEEIIESCIGFTNDITITDKYLVLRGYDTNNNFYKATLDEVTKKYLAAKNKADKNTSMLNKEYMDAYQRYTKLYGKMATIKIGGSSELEKKCTKDSVDDAVLACRSAFENGYVKGLNLTTLAVINELIFNQNHDSLEYVILEMLYTVFKNTSKDVMRSKYDGDDNAIWRKDYDGIRDVTADEILTICAGNNWGFNIITEEFDIGDELTVINSVSTDIEILKGMISILSLILTSNQFISINRMYDRKAGKQQMLADKVSNYKAIAGGICEAIKETLPIATYPLNANYRQPILDSFTGDSFTDDSMGNMHSPSSLCVER